MYVAALLVVNLPVLFLYEATGRPGPFHLLAVVSVLTTALGWLSLRGRRFSEQAVQAHASFMTWSWIGVTTAGLAQLANQQWPEQSPWPVIAIVGLATGLGLAWVPPYVSRNMSRRRPGRRATS